MVSPKRAKECTSCGKKLIGISGTSFLCPVCGKTIIGRCRNCKDQSVKYICKSCGFKGP